MFYINSVSRWITLYYDCIYMDKLRECFVTAEGVVVGKD